MPTSPEQTEEARVIDELHSVADWLRWAATRFNGAELYYGHGTDNAFDEAYAMLLSVLQLNHPVPDYVMQARLTRSERLRVQELIDQRVTSRKPMAYLTHEAWFAGLPFYIDERVLVPRSPIAELIEARFEPWVEADAVTRVLDLCTGSGCIAIACAGAFPNATLTASDLSDEALAVAEINRHRHGLDERIRLLGSDVFEAIPPEPYDLIVSNPPYVDQADMDALPAEFRHEPAAGLAAGHDGLEVVKRILARAGDYLSPDGILVVEVGNSARALEARYPEVPFLWLEFSRGGRGVFLLTAAQLQAHGADLAR